MPENDNHKCCSNGTSSEGTSLLTRFLQALNPYNAPVDPRSVQDILVFAKHYADLIRYYDFDDRIDWVDFENGTIIGECNKIGSTINKQQQTTHTTDHNLQPPGKKQIITWKEFFYKDIAVVVASISRWQRTLPEIKNEYNTIRKQIEANPTKENFRELFLSIIHHLTRIDRWYGRSVEQHPLKSELEVKIKSFLAPALKQLIAYDKGMVLNVADDLDLVTHYEIFKKDPWNISFGVIDADDSVYVGTNLKQKIIYALMYVDDIFNTLYKAYEEITGRSEYYWQQATQEFPQHQPHMALFISFVELFAYAQNNLNQLTRRHLEFFYRDVLHLKEKPANPDSVYLIYQLAKTVDEFDLKKGVELTAGKDASGKQQIYKTDTELVVNKGEVKELKTVFLDKSSPIKNIYAAPVANSADGKGEKFKDEETAWPTFGYFEPRGEGDKLTGEEAGVGIAIASDDFKLSGGERMIVIRIKFDTPPADMPDKLTRFSNELIKIQFSGAKEWITPEQDEGGAVDLTDIGVVYPSESEKILSFINSAETAEDIAGTEPQSGPVYDNPARKTSGKTPEEDYKDSLKLARALIKQVALDKKTTKDFETFSDFLKAKDPGLDKMLDFIFTFSEQYVAWNNEEKELVIKASIHVKEEPIVPFNSQTLKENFPTTLALCKIVFSGTLYKQFGVATIKSINTTVNVNGLTDLIVETDDGPADPSKPIFPFTARPQVGSAFSIGSPEFIGKQLNYFSIKGEWAGELDFANRYLLYSEKRDLTKSYTCAAYIFYDNEWHRITEDVPLFDERSTNNFLISTPHDPEAIQTLSQADATEAGDGQVLRFVLQAPDFGHEEFPVLTINQLANRLNIKGEPVPTGSQNEVGTVSKSSKSDNDLKMVYVPRPPYTPQLKYLNIDYTASQTLHNPGAQVFHIYPFGVAEIFPYPVVDKNPVKSAIEKLIKAEERTNQLIIPTLYMLPQFKFGADQSKLNEIKISNRLVSKKNDNFKKKIYFHLNQYESRDDQQGNLYIGIQNLVPPQNLSLLFKFADGSAYDNDNEPPKINWSYLVNNEWFPLPQDHVVTDSTYGFQTTGIILFDFPVDATNNNTILTSGLYWLCASVESNANRIPKLIDVIAQANQASFSDQQNDPAHYNNPLPEKAISKPLVKIPEIKLITQPFESFDGKPSEQPHQFYQRVSERLRHKNRAITASDYEHLVLEQFPSVYKVKLLSHTDPACLCRYDNDSSSTETKKCCCPQIAPGHVLVIAISNLRNKNAIDPLKPRTGRRTLLKIEEFLKKKVSPFVHVHAKNPKFEEVKVAFNVKFYTGVDKGFFLKKLNSDIMRFLTPWAYDSNVEITFGSKIYASKIIDFIEGLDYVDYITCFRMIHIAEGCCETDTLPDLDCSQMHADLTASSDSETGTAKSPFIAEVSAMSSQAILVSAKQHCIELIDDEPLTEECHCKQKTESKDNNK